MLMSINIWICSCVLKKVVVVASFSFVYFDNILMDLYEVPVSDYFSFSNLFHFDFHLFIGE